MVAITGQGHSRRIIAYFLLTFGPGMGEKERFARLGIHLDEKSDCLVAASVADEYQNPGLGSRLFRHVLDVARRCRMKRAILQGGVRSINHRAIHFYEKHGFRKVGQFNNRGNNYDMLLEL